MTWSYVSIISVAFPADYTTSLQYVKTESNPDSNTKQEERKIKKTNIAKKNPRNPDEGQKLLCL